MNIEFHSKRALVTGGGRGYGRDIAIALAKGGAETFTLSRTQKDLDDLKKECPDIKTVCVDLGDWDATRKAISDIGPIDLLVNNAGTAIVAPFLECKPEDFDRMMNVNVKAMINVSQVVAKGMVERGQGGSIVNVSSAASLRALKDHTIYNATKGAVDSLSMVMALELGPHKIRVNTINPTVTLTPLGRQVWSDPVKNKQLIDRIPLGRFAEVEEVVHAVLFLLSDKSSMINGIQLPIDGGLTMG